MKYIISVRSYLTYSYFQELISPGSPEKGDVSVLDSREQQKVNYCGRHNGYVAEATMNFPKARSRSRICSIGEENTLRKEELKIDQMRTCSRDNNEPAN
jgi:hypothetical protein